MNGFVVSANRLEHALARRLARHQETLLQASIDLLRISLGLVFLLFGALKFVPGLSPAEELATRTMEALTFGLLPAGLGLVVVATIETVIGFTLLTGRYPRLGLTLLALAMAGILSPLVLFTGDLFAGPNNAPTLAAQYVFKDIVLLAAALVVTARALGRHPAATAWPKRPAEIAEAAPRRRAGAGDKTRRGMAAAAMLLLLAGYSAPGGAAAERQAATPVPPRCAAGNSADADEAIAAVERVFACLAAEEHAAAAALITRDFAATALGLPDGADVAAHLAGFFPFALESIGNARSQADGRLSADVVYRREEGQHMLVHERWIFVQQGDALLLDAIEPLPVEIEGAVNEVNARMTSRGFDLDHVELPAGEAVRFTVTNARPGASDFAVFALPEGTTLEDMRQRGLPPDHRFMGAVFLEPGATGELMLVALDPGAYAIASFGGDAAGTPAGFTVR